MRCEDVKERFVELLYDEPGTPPASPELRGHLASCPACRRELAELQETRSALAAWTDEAPLRPILLPRADRASTPRRPMFFRYLGYAAAAAAVALAFLALANAEITWNRDGLAFRTHLFSSPGVPRETYTKAEVRSLLKAVVDDTESRVMETNYLMMQRMMDTIEEDRRLDWRLVRTETARNHNKN